MTDSAPQRDPFLVGKPVDPLQPRIEKVPIRGIGGLLETVDQTIDPAVACIPEENSVRMERHDRPAGALAHREGVVAEVLIDVDLCVQRRMILSSAGG
jgi:hypothetical protein